MEVVVYNISREMRKARKGKPLKKGVDLGILLYTYLEGIPKAQKAIARAFGIKQCRRT